MSKQDVIDWRARALFRKFWERLSDNPDWVKRLFQSHPELMTLLIQAIINNNGAGKFEDLRQRFRAIAMDEVKALAATQVDEGSFDIERISDTLRNQ